MDFSAFAQCDPGTMNTNISTEEVAYVLLEKLKANGTFDEFRRFCVSDIDAKSSYQNWKQRIESSALKFLNKIEYTPELNKNIVWEKMRKHLLDGLETQDISDGADRILNQILGPRTLDAFEPKIRKVVNEYLGNENGTVTTEVNSLNEITTSLKIVSENNINASIKSKIDLIPELVNLENEEVSPEFEPLTSGFINNDSDNESVSGMSDLLSVDSPVQIMPKEINDTSNTNELETNSNIVEDVQKTLNDKNGIINDKNKSTNNEPMNTNIISYDSEKLKTNELKYKSKHSSKASDPTSSQDKSSSHRSKNRNSNSNHSTSQEKVDIKKRSDSHPKDRKSRSHKHHSSSKDKDRKNKHKKTHHSDRDKTPKRDRKDSRSDKKEKSSSLCKEPKSLNGNRSDDESNAGGSSKQKSSLSKNKSSTSEKSKSSSSNHKTSRNNNSKDVVNKSKEQSSSSSNSHSLNQMSIQNKKRKIVEEETNNANKKTKLTKDSVMTDDEQNVANVLLSMSLSHFCDKDTKENIVSVGISSTEETLNTNVAKNGIRDDDQISSSSIDSKNKIVNSIKDIVESSLPMNSWNVASMVNKLNDNLSKIDCVDGVSSFKEEHSETSPIETTKINSEDHKAIGFIDKNKEVKKIEAEINLNSNANKMTGKHDFNTLPTVSNPKLLPTQIDANRKRRCSIKVESKAKKIKSLILSGAIDGTVIDDASKIVLHKQNDKPCDIENKINDSTLTNILDRDDENCDSTSFGREVLTVGFKGFSSTDGLYCEHRQHLINVLKTLLNQKSPKNLLDDGFSGFDDNTALPCKNRNAVYSAFIKSVQRIYCFKGFEKKDLQKCKDYDHLKRLLEIMKNNRNQDETILNGKNGIQSQTTFNNVMAIIRESEKDRDNNDVAQNDNYSQSDCETEKQPTVPVVNNNNHDITPSNHWVVEQEMKYKLLPVKVKLERLMEYRCPNAKSVTKSSEVSSTTQREKID